MLRELFEERRSRNAAYSLSAFARDLGVSISVLSRTLNGRRPASLKLGLQISAALGLSQGQSKALTASILHAAPKAAKISKKLRTQLENETAQAGDWNGTPTYTTVELERFKSISNWYHLAILNLARLADFDSDPVAISARLGILSSEAKSAIDRMIALGLLVEDQDGKLTRSNVSFYIQTQKSEVAMRRFHTQMMQKATEQLQDGSPEAFQKRLINGVTLACSSEQIETIKDKINEFQDSLIGFVAGSTNEPNQVYQFNVQLFPLTVSKNERKGR